MRGAGEDKKVRLYKPEIDYLARRIKKGEFENLSHAIRSAVRLMMAMDGVERKE